METLLHRTDNLVVDEVAVFSKALRTSVTFKKGNIMNKSSLLFSALLGVATITAQAGELYTPEQYQDPAASGTSPGRPA